MPTFIAATHAGSQIETLLANPVSAARALPISVDVGDALSVPPAIFRGGVSVVPPIVSTKKVDDFVGGLVPISRLQVPRVLSQSVAANVRVALGTAIDLVLVPVNNINVGLLDGTHADLSNLLITQMLPLVQNPAVKAILDKTTDPTTLSTADQDTIKTAFTAQTQAAVVDTDPTRNFATTFNTLQSVRSFE